MACRTEDKLLSKHDCSSVQTDQNIRTNRHVLALTTQHKQIGISMIMYVTGRIRKLLIVSSSFGFSNKRNYAVNIVLLLEDFTLLNISFKNFVRILELK